MKAHKKVDLGNQIYNQVYYEIGNHLYNENKLAKL